MTASRAYDFSYRLREESRESWDHIISDKFIYAIDSRPIDFNSLVGVAKDYINRDIWVELHFVLHAQGKIHYSVVVEYDEVSRNAAGETKINGVAVDRNPTMLVDIAQFIELPKEIVFYACAIPSAVRLKRIDNCDCAYWNSAEVFIKPRKGLFVPQIKNWKLGVLSILPGSMSSQSPHQLIESGAQTKENIASDDGQVCGRIDDFNLNLIHSSLNVVFASERTRLRLLENRPLSFQGVKMFLRPRCLELGISEVHH